ncbi:MAG: oligosaccharide flippase family protein, partial [Geminicoccaceae bacterium]
MKDNPTFHTAVYSASSFLVAIAGLITFPILTRVLSVEEYGILNLISLTIMVLVGLGKAGLQTSIVRFGSEARSGNKGFKENDVYLTALVSMFVIVVCLQLAWSIASQFLPLSMVGDERAYLIFILAGLLVIGEVVGSGLHNILISEKKSVVVSLVNIAKKYSLIALIVPGLLLSQEKIFTFYLLSGIHEILFLLISLYLCQRYFAIFSGCFCPSLNRQLFAFGLPLIGFEVLGHIISFGDRVLINYFLGTAALGYYAAASNLCVYIETVFVASMTTAITPIFLDRWEREGKESTENFLALVMRYYLLVTIPAAIGVAAVGQDLITFLAGEKYAEGHRVIPYIIAGMLISGTSAITTAGLRIKKRTNLMMGIVAFVAVLNVAFNLALIPPFGIEGAAFATLLSFLGYTWLNYYFGRKILAIRFDVMPVLLYSTAGLAMYMAVTAVDVPIVGLRLFLKIGVGVLVYSVLVLIIDRDIRRLVIGYVKPAW